MSAGKHWLLLTNDDGIEAVGFEMLVKALHSEGYPLAVIAPSENHSATGMRINLMKPMGLRSRDDLTQRWGLDPHKTPVHLFELDGSPCDTMIVALDGGLNHLVPGAHPQMVVSGVNLGPNLSQDSYHSGTMGAAREAGLYGVPAIASSFTKFDAEGMEKAIQATLEAVAVAAKVLPPQAKNLGRPNGSTNAGYYEDWPMETGAPQWAENPNRFLRSAFADGDLMLNVNVPPTWDGGWASTRLGVRWYRNAVRFEDTGTKQTATFTIGAASVDHSEVNAGDCDAVELSKASLSCLAVWPQSHPFAVSNGLMAHALNNTVDGWPSWLVKD